ncbi:DMT family transporter [Hymenobacter sp. RP-2-7]|uniref:DMT family transporter n=1 Tax=Hymenobacter polaris TaxID=2682546 RepID=A0A7Y0ADG4_9BACT|nr:DMT family transporter [Hymenobacter polaris]NML65305.1 DMT family transporter [Hymenobacter polaris]
MSSFRIHAALFLAALIYAATYSLAKDLMPGYIQPQAAVVWRIGGATLVFGLLKLLTAPGERIVGAADNWRAIACGVLGIGLNQLAFFQGLSLSTPINASLIQTISPIVVVLASAVLLGERITPPRLLGIALGACGAAALVLSRPPSGKVAADALAGNLFLLFNATVFALYLVLVAPLMRKYHAFTVLARIFLVGAAVVLPVGLPQALHTDYGRFPAYIWAELGYMVLFLTILAYLLNNWALKYASPNLLGVYIYLQPVLAVLIAVALGKDVFTLDKAWQAALIFLGVWLVGRNWRTASAKPKPAAVPAEATVE